MNEGERGRESCNRGGLVGRLVGCAAAAATQASFPPQYLV
jgi:hypothetical protein